MSPEALAALHASASAQPWSAASFASLLEAKSTILIATPDCFALGRVVLDEAELLQIATHPEARRQGFARFALGAFEHKAAERGAAHLFLEVAESNQAARGLYLACDWQLCGRRRGYYARPGGAREDALLMQKTV